MDALDSAAIINDRYRIEELVGCGSMGEVFRARDLDLDRDVAIKLLPTAKNGDERARARFLEQGRAMARIQHPGVVQVYERGQTAAGLPFLVMEYLRGPSLRALLTKTGPLTPAIAVGFGIQLCRALAEAHRVGVIHRDIKASNVVVTGAGVDTNVDTAGLAGAQLKIIDFGLAQFATAADLTRTGDLLGTLPYLAPEVAVLQRPHSSASDAYAVGCVLYEMLLGHLPIRGASRPELLAAIANDPPVDPAHLDADLRRLLLRCLAKQPEARPAPAELALALDRLALPQATHPGLASGVAPGPGHGSLAEGRFRITDKLGVGQHGTVYAAVDCRTGREVAVKRLHVTAPDELFRLKREFRSLRDLDHPNLLRHEELVLTASEACLSMERIAGQTLLEHVREHPDQLEVAFEQLLRGLHALHGAGLVHRDIKPSNVRVDVDGRVVILDFGLTIRARDASDLAGTLAYLAPECLEGLTSPRADLYAVGVILHEALGGRREGALGADAALPGNTPPHLAALCRALLSPRADARPDAEAALGLLRRASPRSAPSDRGGLDGPGERDTGIAAARGGPSAEQSARHPTDGHRPGRLHEARLVDARLVDAGLVDTALVDTGLVDTGLVDAGLVDTGLVRDDHFVGRSDAFGLLAEARGRCEQGKPQTLLVEGPSGIGKTTLLRQMCLRLPPDAWVMDCRCRPGEALPFRGLDAAIDRLVDRLRGLSWAHAAALSPLRTDALTQLFPAFVRVAPFNDAARRGELPRDPVHVRMRAYQQLGELMCRVSSSFPLVLLVDDLHWIDAESASLLTYLLRGPDAPSVLFLAARRPGQAGLPVADHLLDSLPAVTRLSLSGLTLEESTHLARQLLRGQPEEADQGLTTQIATKSGGNPFFVRLLSSYVDREAEQHSVSIEAALWSRIERLTRTQFEALSLVALCRNPLPLEAAAALIGPSSGNPWDTLERAQLVVRVPDDAGGGFEPYHAKVREVVVAYLPANSRRRWHSRLADAWMQRTPVDHASVVEHLAAAGRWTEAVALAERYAAEAERMLAFERAAALFGLALRHSQADSGTRRALRARRALALQRAGHATQAAECMLELAAASEGDVQVGYRLEAGSMLMTAGALERGLEVLEPLLRAHDLRAPRDLAETLTAGMAAYERLAARGLTPADPTSDPSPPAGYRSSAALARIDLCNRISAALAIVDPRGVVFAIQGLHLALDLGEPAPLHEASANFVRVTAGLFPNPLVEPALALCRALAKVVDTPPAWGLLHQAEGEAAHFNGSFLAAGAAFEKAERIALEHCTGAHHQLASARNGFALIEYSQKGDFVSHLERTVGWQLDAEARQDLFHASVLRIAHAIVWIAQDRPDKARAELEPTTIRFPRGPTSAFEVGRLLFLDVVDRYLEVPDAHLRPMQGREDVLESPAARSPFLAGYIHLHRAWGCLRAMAKGRHAAGDPEMVRRAVDDLRGLGPTPWKAAADALEGNLAFLDGQREEALSLLESAETAYRATHMLCLAACARRRRGELTGGELGARLLEDSDRALRQLGVAEPERWCRAYFSLFDPEATASLTMDSSGVQGLRGAPPAGRALGPIK